MKYIVKRIVNCDGSSISFILGHFDNVNSAYVELNRLIKYKDTCKAYILCNFEAIVEEVNK